MIDPKEWRPILMEVFNPPSFERMVEREVLGEKIREQRSLEKQVPRWRFPLWAVAFEELTREGGDFRVERTFGTSFRGEAPPRMGRVQVALGKERTVLKEGGAIISMGEGEQESRFVYWIEQNMDGAGIRFVCKVGDMERVEKLFDAIFKWMNENNFYRGQKLDPFGRFLNLSDVSEEDLILPEDIKRELFRNVKTMVERMPEYQKFGIPSKRGVILAGPPGNGKTLSLKVLAKTLPCTFLWCTPVHVRELGFPFIYGFARELAPTVVMAEDADAFGLDRRLGQFNMVLGELLQILDGFEENKGVITVLSSNYAEVLDSALTKRPGRFDVKILVGPPGPNEALKMIKRTMEKRRVVFDGDAGVLNGAAAEMAKHSASGAYVIDMVNYAMMLAVERGQGTQSRLRVTQKDITDSTTRTVSSLELSETMERSVAAEGVYKWGGWASLPKEPNSER